jgi:predicted DCC family thiol-disulfide oxidoreductase YuxK
VAIQSVMGKALALKHGIDPENPDSFLFIDNGVAFAKSDGVLQLVSHLSGPVRILKIGRLLPRLVRDWLYDRTARNRYHLFGRFDICMVPEAEIRHRFSLPD